MKLTKLQKKVIEKQLDPAAKLAKALYLTSVDRGNQHIAIKAFRKDLRLLALMIDDINGVYNQRKKNAIYSDLPMNL